MLARKAGATPPAPPSMLRQRLEQPREETMPTGDGSLANILGILLIFVLVAANGFFVAAEFALVAVRPSRVAQLVAEGRARARALKRATDNLDAYLAATQLGITISSLALGWIGEPALSRAMVAAKRVASSSDSRGFSLRPRPGLPSTRQRCRARHFALPGSGRRGCFARLSKRNP